VRHERIADTELLGLDGGALDVLAAAQLLQRDRRDGHAAEEPLCARENRLLGLASEKHGEAHGGRQRAHGRCKKLARRGAHALEATGDADHERRHEAQVALVLNVLERPLGRERSLDDKACEQREACDDPLERKSAPHGLDADERGVARAGASQEVQRTHHVNPNQEHVGRNDCARDHAHGRVQALVAPGTLARAQLRQERAESSDAGIAEKAHAEEEQDDHGEARLRRR
jgi:hypothetical protein